MCVRGHELEHEVSDVAGYTCNGCSGVMAQGSAMWICRQCDYDLCMVCAQGSDGIVRHRHWALVTSVLTHQPLSMQRDVQHLCSTYSTQWLVDATASSVLVWVFLCHSMAWSSSRWPSVRKRVLDHASVERWRVLDFGTAKQAVLTIITEQHKEEEENPQEPKGWKGCHKYGCVTVQMSLGEHGKGLRSTILETPDLEGWCQALAEALRGKQLGDADTCSRILDTWKLAGRSDYGPAHVYGAMCVATQSKAGGDRIRGMGGGFDRKDAGRLTRLTHGVSGFNALIRLAVPHADWLDWRQISYLFCMQLDDDVEPGVTKKFWQILEDLNNER